MHAQLAQHVSVQVLGHNRAACRAPQEGGAGRGVHATTHACRHSGWQQQGPRRSSPSKQAQAQSSQSTRRACWRAGGRRQASQNGQRAKLDNPGLSAPRPFSPQAFQPPGLSAPRPVSPQGLTAPHSPSPNAFTAPGSCHIAAGQ